MIKRCKLFINLFLGTFLLSLIINPIQVHAKDVCATVKIEILQEMTFERQAFEARMKITNGLDSAALENIRIDISLVDENGEEDPNLFFITLTSKTGLSSDPDGSGRIDSGGSAEIYWLLIPAKEAAGNTPLGKRYFAGATLGYTMMGEQNTIIVAPDMIHVLPQPYLKLDYFRRASFMGIIPSLKLQKAPSLSISESGSIISALVQPISSRSIPDNPGSLKIFWASWWILRSSEAPSTMSPSKTAFLSTLETLSPKAAV